MAWLALMCCLCTCSEDRERQAAMGPPQALSEAYLSGCSSRQDADDSEHFL